MSLGVRHQQGISFDTYNIINELFIILKEININLLFISN